MKPDEVAARFDNRPGYRIVDYGPVGIPVFKVTVIGLVLIKKDLDPLEEFVLRVVDRGLAEVHSIRGILGLTQRVVEAAITRLVQKEYLKVQPGSQPEALKLTDKGGLVAAEHREVKPSELSLPFTFDGFLRRPAWYDTSQLLAPRDLRELSIPELHGLPDRGPELGELDTRDVSEVVSLDLGRKETPFTLLRIATVERRVRLYKQAVALAFRSADGNSTQVAFALDGHLSESHERAFSTQKGIERHALFSRLMAPDGTGIEDVLGGDLAKKARSPEVLRGRAELAKARRDLIETRLHARNHMQAPQGSTSENALEDAEQALTAAEANPALQEVRPLEVYEHAELLQDALTNAREHLLIISPWIRASVVDRAFVEKVEMLLHRGVKVIIGYGLGEEGEDERPHDRKARETLTALAAKHDKLLIKYLGDTHAKVLIKDHEYFVVTSFNWLSFRGDRARTFREELGTLVRIREHVDALFDKMMARIQGL